jgi:hypothetical protein
MPCPTTGNQFAYLSKISKYHYFFKRLFIWNFHFLKELYLVFLLCQIVNLLKQFFLPKTDFLKISKLGLEDGTLVLCIPDLETQVVDRLQ